MAKTKQNKHEILKDKAVVAKQNEKIINDFLLQFAYTLTIGVISIFVYNATGVFQYGMGAYNFTRTFMWVLFAAALVAGITFTVLNIIKGKKPLGLPAVYSFVTSAVAFWFVGVEKVVYYSKAVIPFLEKFASAQKITFAIFPLLGIAIVAEFIVYFARYYSLNSKKKK